MLWFEILLKFIGIYIEMDIAISDHRYLLVQSLITATH